MIMICRGIKHSRVETGRPFNHTIRSLQLQLGDWLTSPVIVTVTPAADYSLIRTSREMGESMKYMTTGI